MLLLLDVGRDVGRLLRGGQLLRGGGLGGLVGGVEAGLDEVLALRVGDEGLELKGMS